MLESTLHRQHLAALYAAALRAVDPARAVQAHLTPEDWAEAERVFVVGAGKAGVGMARAVADLLGPRLTAGLLAVPHAPTTSIPNIEFIEGGHPLPNAQSLEAGTRLAHLLASTTSRDLVIALISGGGSALLELPRPGLTLADLQTINHLLLQCGAPIHDINVIRGALSRIKRGGLARLAHPARVLGLILSDVVGNPLDLIASGPTVLSATANTAWEVIERYNLQVALPEAARLLLHAPAENLPPLATIENRLIASNRMAGEAALEAARALGFTTHYAGDAWQGEARDMGRRFVEYTRSFAQGAQPLCVVAGGESTVTIRNAGRGAGRGGRNQEVALGAALALTESDNMLIAAFATDGVDGPTDAAGAIATSATVRRASALGLDPQQHLTDNNAYPFFAALHDLIFTGPTGTNVNDLLFALIY